MIQLEVTRDISATGWPEVHEHKLEMFDVVKIGRLPKGTTSGNSTISVLMRSKDGKQYALGETTMRILLSAAAALEAIDNPFAVGRSERELLAAFRQETKTLLEALDAAAKEDIPESVAEAACVLAASTANKLSDLLEEAAGL